MPCSSVNAAEPAFENKWGSQLVRHIFSDYLCIGKWLPEYPRITLLPYVA